MAEEPKNRDNPYKTLGALLLAAAAVGGIFLLLSPKTLDTGVQPEIMHIRPQTNTNLYQKANSNYTANINRAN